MLVQKIFCFIFIEREETVILGGFVKTEMLSNKFHHYKSISERKQPQQPPVVSTWPLSRRLFEGGPFGPSLDIIPVYLSLAACRCLRRMAYWHVEHTTPSCRHN